MIGHLYIFLSLIAGTPDSQKPLRVVFTRSPFAIQCDQVLATISEISAKPKNLARYAEALQQSLPYVRDKKEQKRLMERLVRITLEVNSEVKKGIRSQAEAHRISRDALSELQSMGSEIEKAIIAQNNKPIPWYIKIPTQYLTRWGLAKPLKRLQPTHHSWPIFDDEWNEISETSRTLSNDLKQKLLAFFRAGSPTEFLGIDSLANHPTNAKALAALLHAWAFDEVIEKAPTKLGIREKLTLWIRDPEAARSTYKGVVSAWLYKSAFDEYFRRLLTYAFEHGKPFKPRRKSCSSWIIAMPNYQFKINLHSDGSIRNVWLVFYNEDELIRALPNYVSPGAEMNLDPLPRSTSSSVVTRGTPVISQTSDESASNQVTDDEAIEQRLEYHPLDHSLRPGLPQNVLAVLDKLNSNYYHRKDVVELLAYALISRPIEPTDEEWVRIIQEMKAIIRGNAEGGFEAQLYRFEDLLKSLGKLESSESTPPLRARVSHVDILNEAGIELESLRSELTFNEVQRLLEKLGYRYVRTNKHHIFESPRASRPKPVPNARSFNPVYARTIIRDAALSIAQRRSMDSSEGGLWKQSGAERQIPVDPSSAK
jgi:hypothetical protein